MEGRSVRTVKDYDALAGYAQEHGISEEDLYERKPWGITALKRILGGDLFKSAEQDGYIIKPAGKPTLVRTSDPRKNIVSKQETLSHF